MKKLKPINSPKGQEEDYNNIFNVLKALTLLGIMFIGCTTPTLLIPNDPVEHKAAKFLSIESTVTFPDVSYAFEVKENVEIAKSHISEVFAIYEMIDSIEPEASNQIYVGKFYVTCYAATVEQCGSTSGITASGRYCTEDPTCWTVAVDPKVIPLGTYLKIDLEGYEDVVFRADDTGSAIQGYDLDIYSSSEQYSKEFPCYSGIDVWIVED